MSRGGGRGHTRVKTSRGRTPQSNRWLERQLNDPYVKRAKAEGYRSRAVYKLLELDEKFDFLKGSKRIVDLGIAPGGWTQLVRKRLPKAAVVGIDLLPVDPIEGATILQMDFMDDAAPDRLIEELGGARSPSGPARRAGHRHGQRHVLGGRDLRAPADRDGPVRPDGDREPPPRSVIYHGSLVRLAFAERSAFPRPVEARGSSRAGRATGRGPPARAARARRTLAP